MVIWNYPQLNRLILSIEFDCQICQGDCTPEILMEWFFIAILWGSSSATFHYTGSLTRILVIVYEIMIDENPQNRVVCHPRTKKKQKTKQPGALFFIAPPCKIFLYQIGI